MAKEEKSFLHKIRKCFYACYESELPLLKLKFNIPREDRSGEPTNMVSFAAFGAISLALITEHLCVVLKLSRLHLLY